MSELKFTPGPWKAEKPEGSNGWWDVFGNDSVCTCYSLNAGNNANLISAAPKMYGALEIALAAIRKNLASYSVKDEQALLEAFNEIEAAMKKARGEK